MSVKLLQFEHPARCSKMLSSLVTTISIATGVSFIKHQIAPSSTSDR